MIKQDAWINKAVPFLEFRASQLRTWLTDGFTIPSDKAKMSKELGEIDALLAEATK